MERRWSSFDRETTNKEFATIPIDDRVRLFEAMKLYRLDARIGYVIKNYGEGLMMLKPTSGAGRCLFFCEPTETGQELVALLAYKKEWQKAPEQLVRMARLRMKMVLDKPK